MIGGYQNSIRGSMGRDDVSSIKCFVLLSCFFMCGAVIGTAAGGYVSGEAGNMLSGTVSDYLGYINEKAIDKNAFLTALIDALTFPVLSVFFGTSVFGFLLIPPLMAARGFFLGFAASAMIRAFGADGRLLVFAAYGIGALFTVPCLFILSIQSMQLSGNLFGLTVTGTKGAGMINRRYFILLLICMAVIFLSAILDHYLTPYLIRLSVSFVV
ncbi:MAG: hypothetical protein GX111_14165 [Clostridiales bacterium]|nr:hypothetical protein [Clostridiales bacterium]